MDPNRIASEGLASILLQLLLPVRETRRMDVVGAGDLGISSVRLQWFENDLKIELGAVRTLAHGRVGLVGLQEPKPPAIQLYS